MPYAYPTSASVPAARFVWFLLLVLAALASVPAAQAQAFDADRYLAQCLRFEAGGDLSSARDACRNALQIAPDRRDVQLALARIETGLGEHGAARVRLRALDGTFGGAEPALLLGEIAVAEGRFGEAEGHLADASARLGDDPDRTVAARLAFLSGSLAEGRGETRTALDRYGEAIAADGLAVEPRLADAHLRFVLGDLAGARQQLEAYQAVSGDDLDPRVRSLLGRTLWAQGDLEAAAGQFETALTLWNPRRTTEQARDLRALGLVYLGQGDVGRGELALREAGRRGNQLALLGGNLLLWIVLALAVLVAHLLAESRIESRSGLELIEGPQPWTVGNVYGTVLLAGGAALVVGVLVGFVMYDNLLALLTPHQAAETRAVMAIVFTLVAALLVVQRIRKNGWSPGPRLLGSADTWAAGVLVGLGMLAVTVAWFAWGPDALWARGLWIDLSRVTGIVVAAVLILPFSEFLFRPFAFDALEYRYGTATALFLAGALSALVLSAPIVLLLPFGVLLAELYRRSRSGTLVLAAQATLHVGLMAVAALLPWARGFFL